MGLIGALGARAYFSGFTLLVFPLIPTTSVKGSHAYDTLLDSDSYSTYSATTPTKRIALFEENLKTMADSLCGPSNPIQAFRKETSVDKTLQRDRIVSNQPFEQVSFASSVLLKSDVRTMCRGSDPILALIQVSLMLSSKHSRRDIRSEMTFHSTSIMPLALHFPITRLKASKQGHHSGQLTSRVCNLMKLEPPHYHKLSSTS